MLFPCFFAFITVVCVFFSFWCCYMVLGWVFLVVKENSWWRISNISSKNHLFCCIVSHHLFTFSCHFICCETKFQGCYDFTSLRLIGVVGSISRPIERLQLRFEVCVAALGEGVGSIHKPRLQVNSSHGKCISQPNDTFTGSVFTTVLQYQHCKG